MADQEIDKRAGRGYANEPMTKLLALVIILLMVVHVIRPFGLPGLKRRADFWKIGLAAIAAIALTIAIRPGG